MKLKIQISVGTAAPKAFGTAVRGVPPSNTSGLVATKRSEGRFSFSVCQHFSFLDLCFPLAVFCISSQLVRFCAFLREFA
ncbi:MAG: hypothetical protein ACLQSR_06560 [Limisphaerales bacterium]